MKYLKIIFESIHRSEIKDYFYDFTDKFEYVNFVVAQDRIDEFEVFISIKEDYWYKNKQEISYSLHQCYSHLMESTGLIKIESENYFKYNIDRIPCRIIRKKLKLR